MFSVVSQSYISNSSQSESKIRPMKLTEAGQPGWQLLLLWRSNQAHRCLRSYSVFMPLNTMGRKWSGKPNLSKTLCNITLFWDQEVTRLRTAHVFGKSTPLTWWLVVSLCWLQYLSICPKCRYKQALHFLSRLCPFGIFPDFSWFCWYWLPTFWNFMVASDHIVQNPSPFPQDTQFKLSKSRLSHILW